MGYYIQTRQTLNKATQIKALYGAEEIPRPNTFEEIPADKGLICVVDNGAFEAAGFCFDKREFAAFTQPDDRRRRTWLTMDRKELELLTKFCR